MIKKTEEDFYVAIGVKKFGFIVRKIGLKCSLFKRFFLSDMSINGLYTFIKDNIKCYSRVSFILLFVSLLSCFIVSTPILFIIGLISSLLAGYFLMLQRYNYIKLNKVYLLLLNKNRRKENIEHMNNHFEKNSVIDYDIKKEKDKVLIKKKTIFK